MPNTTEQQFLSYFEQRRDAFRELLRLSARQQEHINGDDYSELLVVLGQKQQIINRVVSTRSQHTQVVDHWRQQRKHFNSESRSRCDALLSEAETLLSQVMESDERSTTDLRSRRDATQGQLQKISQGTQAHRAYATDEVSTHRFLDIDQ